MPEFNRLTVNQLVLNFKANAFAATHLPCTCPPSTPKRKWIPAYNLDNAASLAAALKLVKVRGPQPLSLWVLSVKAVFAPKIWFKTPAAALD